MTPLKFSRAEKFLLFCLAAVQFTHIIDFMILMPLGPQLMRTFDLSAQQFGLLVSSYTFSAGAMGLLSAFFIDKFDRKKALIFFYFGFALGTVACGLSQDYVTLLMARTLTGAFGGILSALTLSIVADAIGPERRATATGILMTSFSVASIVGVPLSITVAQRWDWHAPFISLGILSLLVGALFFMWVPPMNSHLVDRVKDTNRLEPFLRVLKNRNQMTALLFMFLLVMGQFTVIPFLSPALVANAGLPESHLPLIYLVGGLCSIVSGPLIGRQADRVGKKRVFFWGAMISMIPMLVMTNLGPSPVALSLLMTAFFFVTMGARMIPATALVTSTVQSKHRGSFMSLVSSTQQFSSAIASLLAGMIVVRAEDGRLLNYPIVGAIAIVSSALAIVLIQKIRPLEGEDR